MKIIKILLKGFINNEFYRTLLQDSHFPNFFLRTKKEERKNDISPRIRNAFRFYTDDIKYAFVEE